MKIYDDQSECVVKNNHCRVIKRQMKSRKEGKKSGVLGRKRVQIGGTEQKYKKIG